RTFWRVPNPHLPRFRIEASVDAGLPSEPDTVAAIEGSSVELGILPLGWQRPDLDLFSDRIEPHDGVAPGICEPRCSVRPDDGPLRARILAKRNPLDLSATWLKSAGYASSLPCVPNLARGTCSDVMREVALRQLVVFRVERAR